MNPGTDRRKEKPVIIRLFGQLEGQKVRLGIVGCSILIYTIFKYLESSLQCQGYRSFVGKYPGSLEGRHTVFHYLDEYGHGAYKTYDPVSAGLDLLFLPVLSDG